MNKFIPKHGEPYWSVGYVDDGSVDVWRFTGCKDLETGLVPIQNNCFSTNEKAEAAAIKVRVILKND